MATTKTLKKAAARTRKKDAAEKVAAKKVAARKTVPSGITAWPQHHAAIFATLRDVFAETLPRLQTVTDNAKEYTLHTRVASPFKQHRGAPIFFASVRDGKAYASFHLFPLYANPKLTATISPGLKKRMQGKTCFHFKAPPEPELLEELRKLSQAGLRDFEARGWA